jgi:iron complex transport system substrate-binding protein
VSLYAGHTDNVIALGAGDKLVAVSGGDESERSTLPPDVRRLPMRTGAEAILVLKPDVVLLRSLVTQVNPHLLDTLERSSITAHVIDPPSWDGFEDYLIRLAGVLGTDPKEARDKLGNLRENISISAARAALGKNKPRVFLEATSRELHTCAPESWAARLIDLAGGLNIASEAAPLREGSPIAPWGGERILEAAGDLGFDVYLVQQGPMNAVTFGEVLSRPWFAALNARLAVIPESCLSRPSLLGLEEGGKMLIEILYGGQ